MSDATEYVVDGNSYCVKSKRTGKWYVAAKHMTALWITHADGAIECVNLSEIEKTGLRHTHPRSKSSSVANTQSD